ncbi:MAG: hypothetical protein JXB85_18575 [Anaerolineales bacterium]|nr:hypothetical protein [Anaerolineales bacterium]
METSFPFLTTHIGSVPHPTPAGLTDRLVSLLDIPAWPQMVRRSFRESMYIQYAPLLPGIVVNEARQKISFDTHQDLSPALETFYTHILEDDVDAFALQPDFAAGFFAMLESLHASTGNGGSWAKGQVTGPISFGLTVTDQDLRASLYHDILPDAIVKNMAFNARWQVRQLKAVRPNVIIFADEPYMASFGSAFINLSREQVLLYLNEVFDAIHAEGALTGVHCCANTDWSVLMAAQVDILNLDAYGYIENLGLYPEELRLFLDRGGVIAWGLVPNNEEIHTVTPQGLAERMRQGLQMISAKARARGVILHQDDFAARSLLSPACGLGPTSIEVADKVFETLAETGRILQSG